MGVPNGTGVGVTSSEVTVVASAWLSSAWLAAAPRLR